MDPSKKQRIKARKLRAQGPAFAAATYRSDWPIATKKVALELVGHDPDEDLWRSGLATVAAREAARQAGDPGGIAWQARVNKCFFDSLLLLDARGISAAANRFPPTVKHIALAAYAFSLRYVTDHEVKRRYAEETEPDFILAARVELEFRKITPKTQPHLGRTMKRLLARMA